MRVTFHLPPVLQELTEGRRQVVVETSVSNLADVLAILWTRYPGVRDRIADEQGYVREHINIFIGEENVRYTGGLATQINSSCEISIVPAVSGGISSKA